jgi:hypothetical protein
MEFHPYRDDLRRFHRFAKLFAKKRGLHVHPNQRDVFRFILALAEKGLRRRASGDEDQRAA